MGYRGGGTREQAALDPPEDETVYPEPARFGILPAYAFFARHVRGLDVYHMEVASTDTDLRSPFILDDVARVSLAHVRARSAEGVATLIARRVKELFLHEAAGRAELRRETVDDESF
jgi:hypothetical protein